MSGLLLERLNPFLFLPDANDSFIVFSSFGSFHLFQCFLRQGVEVLGEAVRSFLPGCISKGM